MITVMGATCTPVARSHSSSRDVRGQSRLGQGAHHVRVGDLHVRDPVGRSARRATSR